jgi:hypothetical protein
MPDYLRTWLKKYDLNLAAHHGSFAPTPDVKRGKTDIGNFMSVVGCIPVVIEGAR